MCRWTVTKSLLLNLFKILFLTRTVSSSFLVEPKNQQVVRGETALFKCAVTNDVTTVYWYYSLGLIDGWISVNYNLETELAASKKARYSIIGDKTKGEYFLQIREVTDDDIGDYKCFYYPSKQSGPNRTPEASLTIMKPPKTPLCRMNRPDTAIPSQEISMRCTGTGDPTPRLVWLKNGKPIEGNNPRLSLNILNWNMTEGDVGNDFTCVVDYPKMSKPPSCRLTPLPLNPVVSVVPSVQTLVLNKTGKFVCESTGIPGPLKYKWFINGEVPALQMVKDVHFRIKHDGKTFKILWVLPVLNDAEVTCRVTGKDPNKPSAELVRFGNARSYVSRSEVFSTVRAVTVDGNTVRSDTNGTAGGKYIKGENQNPSDDITNSEAKADLNEEGSSNATVIGVVLSMLILLALVIVLAIFLYKRNNQINQSGKRLSAQFMKCVSIKSASSDEPNGDAAKNGGAVDSNDLYAKPVKSKKGSSKQYDKNDEQLVENKPVVLPRLVSKKKEQEEQEKEETAEDTSCVVVEKTDADVEEMQEIDLQDTNPDQDDIIEIGNDCETDDPVNAADDNSETSKSGSLLKSIYAKLPTEKISSFMNDIRPKKPTRTFAESMNRLRTKIVQKRKNKEETSDSVEEDYAAVNIEETAVTEPDENVQEVVVEQDTRVEKSEIEVLKEEVEDQKSEEVAEKMDEQDVTEETDIPSSLPSENTTMEKPVLRRNKQSAVSAYNATSSKSDAPNKRSSLTLDNLLSNVKRRSLSRRFSGFENRGSTPDLRLSRRIDKNDIVHFVPLGKSNEMPGNVEVVKNRNSINFETEMSQTLLKSFHTVVPNQLQPTNERIIDDSMLYENLDEKESYVSDCSPYMTDEFSEDEFDGDEGKPVERVAPMRIIDDTPVYENAELKPLNETNSKTPDNSTNTVTFNSTKQTKPTMRVKPTPTPRSFRRQNGSSNSSPESQKSGHYKDLPSEIRKKNVNDTAKDIDPTTGESIYDNVDYQQ